MKVAFYVYPTAFQNPGGGEIQLLKTKQYLEEEGLQIKLFDPWYDKIETFDILHTFGSVKDALPMMEVAKRAGVKNVLSTICWYNWKSAWGVHATLPGRALSVMRHFAKEFLSFIPSKRKRMMDIADILLPNSLSEAGQLQRYFQISSEKITVIPNGVDTIFADASPELFQKKFNFKKFALCVGRIEPRKNQLNMIRALSGTNIPFALIGDPVTNYPTYYQQCLKEAGANIHFLGGMPHNSELLRSAFAACDIFLLASWLETPGLAALEAGLAGAKIVITQEGATHEYFKNLAAYVAPDNTSHIRRVVGSVFQMQKNTLLRDHIKQNHLWSVTAKETLKIYKRLLSL